MSAPAEPPTRAACVTPPGTGAIATLGIHGPRAWEVAQSLFRPLASSTAWPPAKPRAGQFWTGRFGEEKIADEVVLTLRQLNPVPSVELHCHGGREVVRWLLQVLADHGIDICSWQTFERATADNALQAEAAIALGDAPTLRTASILLDQYQGALHRALTDITASSADHRLDDALRQLEKLMRWSSLGRHLTTPWRIAILGAPNVGKSSLANALAGFQRSIVAPTPGTTRDLVTTRLAIDGWPIELIDTAGLRDSAESIEAQGIGLARQAAERADLCLWLLDASAAPIWPPAMPVSPHLVINKIDLPPAWDRAQASEALRISARTGEGLPELTSTLAGWLVPKPPPPGAPIPFTPQLADEIERAAHLMGAGRAEDALVRIHALLARRHEGDSP